MSQNDYASSLRTLRGPFRTKSTPSVGGSGSTANQEGEGESAINPSLMDSATKNLEAEIVTKDVPGSPSKRPQKRRKKVGSKPPCSENVVGEEQEDVEEPEESEPVHAPGPDRVDNYSIAEFAKMMVGIPVKSDWVEMERSGLNIVMQKCAEHWGQVSIFICHNFPFFFIFKCCF